MQIRTLIMQKGNNRGYAILFASFLAALLLAIGIAIFSITIREIKLSTSSRDSQLAFYAADTGLECTLYWDVNGINVFATSTDTPAPVSPLDCFGQDITDSVVFPGGSEWTVVTTADTATTDFTINVGTEGQCAIVTVVKSIKGPGLPSITQIESRGRNTCQSGNLRTVERAIRIAY